MLFFAKPAAPRIVWRNPALLHGARREIYGDTVPEGKKYVVLEKASHSDWRVVTVLTLVDGRAKVAA